MKENGRSNGSRPNEPWTCQECGKGIAEGEGYLEFSNADPERGQIGGDPRRPSRGLLHDSSSEDGVRFYTTKEFWLSKVTWPWPSRWSTQDATRIRSRVIGSP